MVEIDSVTVRLGERDYVIRQAGFARAQPWKKRLLGEINPLFAELESAQDLSFSTPNDLVKLLPVAERLLVDAAQLMFELTLAYAPNLETDRAYLEEYATDKQILSAFQEVVKLADFFGLANQLTRRIGRATNGTS